MTFLARGGGGGGGGVEKKHNPGFSFSCQQILMSHFIYRQRKKDVL